MDYRTLVNKLEAIQAGTYIKEAIANPYTDPAQAAIFNAMSDADQEWLTRGGGVPDITDKYILMRAPNKGQPDPAKAAAKQKTQADTTSDAFIKEKLAKLAELVAKLKAGSQGAKPATMPAQATSIEQAKALGAANPQVKESSIANELVESFGYQTTNEGPATTAALKATGKLGARVIPGAGLALGAYDAYNRAKQGDWTGAAIDAAGGVAGLIPGVGTAAQIGLMGVQAGRDKARTGSFFPDDNEIKTAAAGQAPAATQAAKPAAGVDPKVQALQQKLIAAGAKIKADGIMGPATQAAMKQFPQVKESVAESMASLRDRLAMIETEQATDENLLTSLGKGGVNLYKGAKFGFANPTMAKNLTQASHSLATKGGRLLGRGAATVAKNPKTAIAGAAALGTGLGYAATSKPTGTTPPVKPPSTSTQGGKPTPDGSTTTATADPELIKQIQAVMGEIADIETPEVIAALQNAQAAIEGKPVTAAAPATQAAKPATAPAPQSNFGTGL
jgi:peptidoglycan hydrolase-like protein with peptidoglycan-binding domain